MCFFLRGGGGGKPIVVGSQESSPVVKSMVGQIITLQCIN